MAMQQLAEERKRMYDSAVTMVSGDTLYANNTMPDLDVASDPPTIHVERLASHHESWSALHATMSRCQRDTKREYDRACAERDDLTNYVNRLEAELSALADVTQRIEAVEAADQVATATDRARH